MKIISCVQGSPEWFAARKGIPTASNFDKILTPKTQKPSSSIDEYIYELIAESRCLTPPPSEYRSAAMQHGVQYEREARHWYELERGVDVRQVGFCVEHFGPEPTGRFGCSPDGLVGEDGGLELKCPTGKVHVKYLLAGVLPDEHKCQVHGCLAVTGRQWWDYLSYCPGLPPLLVRVTPNSFTAALMGALKQFGDRYAEALARLAEIETPIPLVQTLRKSVEALT